MKEKKQKKKKTTLYVIQILYNIQLTIFYSLPAVGIFTTTRNTFSSLDNNFSLLFFFI